MIKIRGIRGANISKENSKDSIFKATREILEEIFNLNPVQKENIAAIYFTLTRDLNAAFPAEVAREMGLTSVPLLCMQEIEVPNSMAKVVRVLMLVNTSLGQNEIKHVYIGQAKTLRDDI